MHTLADFEKSGEENVFILNPALALEAFLPWT